jgi:hypothetical protein
MGEARRRVQRVSGALAPDPPNTRIDPLNNAISLFTDPDQLFLPFELIFRILVVE